MTNNIIFYIFACLLGIIVGFWGSHNFILLPIAFIFLLGLCVLFFLTFKKIRFLPLLSMLFFFLTYICIAVYEAQKAHTIIKEIEAYHSKNLSYPFSLLDLNRNIDTQKYHYETNDARTYFSLQYAYDGWNIETYDNRDRKWITTD